MFRDNTSIIIVALCLAGAIVSVIGEWRKWEVTRSVSKLTASTAFVVLAGVSGAAGSGYGRFVLTALVFSWIGDALLLSTRSSFFLAGITAFFIAHLMFAAAFISRPFDITWLVAAFAILGAAGFLFHRWLWRHLKSFFRIAVPFYLAAIVLMTSLAIAVSGASAAPVFAIAAMTFAASDVAVAQDRFIKRGILNKAWGLPLYFVAQILFALSVLVDR